MTMRYGNGDTLVFAHVIFRHGERNIIRTYPNDPYKDESNWSGGFAQLTNEGKRQLHRFGQFLRRRYHGLIGTKYSPNEIYIQSTDFDRTIMSAQSALSGLYPPTDDEKWSDEILWQPIPVHVVAEKLNYILPTKENSPKLAVALSQYLKDSSEIHKIYAEHAELFEQWSEKSGWDIKTIQDVNTLHDALKIEKARNMPLPDWANEAMEPNSPLHYIAKFFFKIDSNTPELAKLKSGPLLKEIMERFTQKSNSQLVPDRSLWLYSAHDTTICAMLNSLGLLEMHFPPFAASLHFELYKSDEIEHYIQIYYRTSNEDNPQPMKIPGLGEKFTLKQFYETYEDIIPTENYFE